MAGFTERERRIILERDNYTCQMDCQLTHHCGGPSDPVSIHHIHSQAWCREQGSNPNTLGNGITLCHTYHTWLHQKQDQVNNLNWNPEFDDFMRETTASNNRKLLSGTGGERRKRWKKRVRRNLMRKFSHLGMPGSGSDS